MARSENQKQKLLWIAKLLLTHTDEVHGMTCGDLIDALAKEGISAERKSIYGDIQTLRDFGLHIEMDKSGGNTYYRILDRQFELPELKLLVDAVQSAKFLTEKKSRSLIEKLSTLVSTNEAAALRREVYVSDGHRPANEQVYYTVDAIHSAMAENVKVSFLYFEYNEKKEKVYRHGKARYAVSPWGLIWSNGNYYLVAYDSDFGDLKHYRIDKMERPALTDTPREGREVGEALDLSSYAKTMFDMFHGDVTLVTMRAENRFAGVVLDRFGYEPTFFPDGDDHFTFSVRVSASPQFLGWIMSFGRGIVITAPEQVVDDYRRLAKEILDP
jgi:predicted DNA-binding transcriptional regulator YafY